MPKNNGLNCLLKVEENAILLAPKVIIRKFIQRNPFQFLKRISALL